MARRARPAFALVGRLRDVEAIARGSGIRELRRLERIYGVVSWRKRKGLGRIRFNDGREADAELIRIIDESGEDYAYPASMFAEVTLPESVESALAASG